MSNLENILKENLEKERAKLFINKSFVESIQERITELEKELKQVNKKKFERKNILESWNGRAEREGQNLIRKGDCMKIEIEFKKIDDLEQLVKLNISETIAITTESKEKFETDLRQALTIVNGILEEYRI